VCDWWKLRPKLGQVCDITNIHKLCRGLGASHDVRPEGDLNKKTTLCARLETAESQRHYRPNSDTAFAIWALNTYLLNMVSRTRLPMMDEAKQPEPIESEPKESIASRIERREAEIAFAMKQEAERRAAVIENMHRLRALRLSQTPKASAPIPPAEARRVSKRSA